MTPLHFYIVKILADLTTIFVTVPPFYLVMRFLHTRRVKRFESLLKELDGLLELLGERVKK